MERIAHLSNYGRDTELSGYREGSVIEVAVSDSRGELRVQLGPFDSFLVESEWNLWSNMASCESSVTLLRGDGTRQVIAEFEFDMVSGGWQDAHIVDELKKLGCEVKLEQTAHDHRR